MVRWTSAECPSNADPDFLVQVRFSSSGSGVVRSSQADGLGDDAAFRHLHHRRC